MSDDTNQTDRLEALAAAVLQGFDIEAATEVSEDDEGNYRIAIEGGGSGDLVADGGEIVDAIQHIANQSLARSDGGPRRRVSVDADGYRARREAALERLAERAAAEALEYSEEIELDPMTPHDRRVVHMALKERTDIETRSEGEEPRRRIIVEPAD
ncbi:MAG: protein jag [Miltoncostaeaceae bacterium]